MTDHEEFNFDKYDSENTDPIPIVITPDMLLRRIIWDTVPCDMAVEVIKNLDLPVASDDVEETEHRESHERIAALAPVAQVVYAMTHSTAQAIRSGMIVRHGEEDVLASAGLDVEALTLVLLPAVLAVLAEMQDFDLLHFHPIGGLPL